MSAAIQPLPTLDTMIAVCREARDQVVDDINRNPDFRDDRWRVDRAPCLYALGEDGERLNDGAWCPWERRKRDVENLLARYPNAHEIIVDGGVDVSVNKEAYEVGNYEPVFWQATLWKRDAPIYSVGELESLLRRRSGFNSFEDMFRTSATYRPSFDIRDPEMLAIADYYDVLAQQRDDSRRSYRYGEPRPAAEATEADEEVEGMRP